MADQPISIPDFFAMCEKADWTYDFSDDHSVWQRGARNMSALIALAKSSPTHQKIFDDHKAFIFSGKAFGTEQAPAPRLKYYLPKDGS